MSARAAEDMISPTGLVNRQVRLVARPNGLPTEEVWKLADSAVEDLSDGEALVKLSHISLDPAMRGWMDDVRSYIRPVALGEVMRAPAVGQIIASRNPKLAAGDHVWGLLGAQEYARCDDQAVRLVDVNRAPPERYLGALGITGLTAYFGIRDVGRPRPGDTVVVSGAAGAVGSIAGQIAKLDGCRVIGIAGGQDKCRWLTDTLGFDAAIDYKSDDLRAALRRVAGEGIDVLFDNVGGEILDTALARLRRHARVVICGAISQYNLTGDVSGPRNYLSLLINRASMTGFIVFDYQDAYDRATQELLGWLDAGRLIAREDVIRGPIDAFPRALLDLFSGANTGKLVLELAPRG